MAFGYTGKDEIHLKVGQLVRVYFENMLEYDPVNNLHLHSLGWQGFFNVTRGLVSINMINNKK